MESSVRQSSGGPAGVGPADLPLLLRPVGDPHAAPARPREHVGGQARVGRVGIIAGGGFGGLTVQEVYALARRDGVALELLRLDNDHLPVDPVPLADGQLVGLPDEAFLSVGSEHPRDDLRAYPLLVRLYIESGVLRGIPVFETYPVAGAGGGGYPVISAIDLDLNIREVRRSIRRFLRPFGRSYLPDQEDAWRSFASEEADPAAVERPRIVIVGGACGSFGAASHILLPYLVRDEARRLGLPVPHLIGVVAGPRLYAGLHPRAATNWAATLRQLEALTRDGFQREFLDGEVGMACPPYDRVILCDAEPEGECATSEEIRRCAAHVARGLYMILGSDLWDKVESVGAQERCTPWTTLRAVLAQVDWPAVTAVATATRAADRLAAVAR